MIDETQCAGFEPRSERKELNFLKFQRISAPFLQSFSTFQRISAHYYKVFAQNFLKIELITEHFLHNFWKLSRPGQQGHQCLIWSTTHVLWVWMFRVRAVIPSDGDPVKIQTLESQGAEVFKLDEFTPDSVRGVLRGCYSCFLATKTAFSEPNFQHNEVSVFHSIQFQFSNPMIKG